MPELNFHNGKIQYRESQYLTLRVDTEDRRITNLSEFSEALKLLVNQTSPTIPLHDIRDETEEVLSWFTN